MISEERSRWDRPSFTNISPNYDPNFRQLLHVSFKVAASPRELWVLEKRRNVTRAEI